MEQRVGKTKTTIVASGARVGTGQINKWGSQIANLRLRFSKSRLPSQYERCLSGCHNVYQQLVALRGAGLPAKFASRIAELLAETIELQGSIKHAQGAFERKRNMAEEPLPSYDDVEGLEGGYGKPHLLAPGLVLEIVRGKRGTSAS
jgi:hypothetical protein